MSKIELSRNGIVSIQKDNWESQTSVQRDNIKVYVIGSIRSAKDEIEDGLYNIIDGLNNKKNLQDFFISINGEYCILIEKDEDVELYLSYSYPQFFIYKPNDSTFVLTQCESDMIDGGFNRNRLLLRYSSNQALFIPKGVCESSLDYLFPGMSIKIDKETQNYKQAWILPIDKICSRNDHENLAKDIANDFVKDMASYKMLDGEFTLQLSSGLDSALMLAASIKAGLETKLVHFRPSYNRGESIGAKQMAHFFGKELEELYRGPVGKGERFEATSNIDEYLEKMSPLLNVSSGMFILNDVSLLAAYKYGYHNTLEGSAFPTALSISHETVYPNHRHPKFNPLDNKEKRYKYSRDYFEKKLETNTNIEAMSWNIGEKWPNINPYYWEILEACYTGSSKRDKAYSNFLKFAQQDEFLENLKEPLIERGNNIIEKILLDASLNERLKKADVTTALILMKMVNLFNNAGWASTKLYNYRKAGLMNELRPGLSSKVLLTLLSVDVDEKIINYPKWHLFKAFEILSGKDFFEISKIKNPILTLYPTIIFDKLKRYKDERGVISTNKSVLKFIKTNHLLKRHYEILKELSLDDILPKVDIDNSSLSMMDEFWYRNTLINITSLKKSV